MHLVVRQCAKGNDVNDGVNWINIHEKSSECLLCTVLCAMADTGHLLV
jgi:hypothetical protein